MLIRFQHAIRIATAGIAFVDAERAMRAAKGDTAKRTAAGKALHDLHGIVDDYRADRDLR